MHNDEWKRLNDEVMSFYSQSSCDRADVVAKQALQATEEALAWLCYAKRFVKKGPGNGGVDDSD